jgi:hypothetical protein
MDEEREILLFICLNIHVGGNVSDVDGVVLLDWMSTTPLDRGPSVLRAPPLPDGLFHGGWMEWVGGFVRIRSV